MISSALSASFEPHSPWDDIEAMRHMGTTAFDDVSRRAASALPAWDAEERAARAADAAALRTSFRGEERKDVSSR